MGRTPLTLQLPADKQYLMSFRRSGYEDATVSLNTHAQAGWVVLDILAGMIGVAVDGGPARGKPLTLVSNTSV